MRATWQASSTIVYDSNADRLAIGYTTASPAYPYNLTRRHTQ